jgi:type I restriction enzyme S subunit
MSVEGMPGYKETKVGWIPDTWHVRSLEDISTDNITYGVVQPGSEDENGVPLVRGGDVKGGRISTTLRTISSAVSKQFSRTVLRGGELLVSLVGYPGETAIAGKKLIGANIARQVGLIRLDEAINSQFVQQFLSSPIGKKILLCGMIGSAQQVINLNALREVDVPLPPLPEQQKIAAILTAVDDKLDVIARQIEVAQALKQGLMQSLFSRGVGTQDATGRWMPHAEFKDSELGEIPDGWLITTLGAICNGALQTGPFGSQLHAAEYQDEGIPVLMPKDLLKCRANLSTAARIAPARAEELAKHKLVAGDLLFSRRGDVARFALIDEQSAGALCGTGCLKAKPSEVHSSTYIAHLLQLEVVRAWLEQNAVGQTMPNMNTAILASLPLVAPANKREQEEIAGILDSVDAKIRLLFSKRLHFQIVKRGLMQKLLTGEWRVKLDSPTGTV